MTTADAFDYRAATDVQVRRHDAKQRAAALADRLEASAARIRQTADQFDNERIDAGAVAAEIVQEFMSTAGNLGPIYWSLVRDLTTIGPPSRDA